MRQKMEEKIQSLVQQYAARKDMQMIWRRPIVRFADARNPGFEKLQEIVDPGHHMPADFLAGAKTVISWFLPFEQDLAKENLPGSGCAGSWADAYLITNDMAAWINGELVAFLQDECGVAAAVVQDAGMIGEDNPRSRWSQRHVAYLAGHGTFGLNNMLISDAGSVGRYYSLVTALDVPADQPVLEERCLWKKDGSCGLCVKRCAVGALTEHGFDRFKCLDQCLENMARYPGADVCGKCTVELPCSYRIPGVETQHEA